MIDMVEVGKKYRLIDKDGWLNYGGNSCHNASLLRRGVFDSDNCVIIDQLDGRGCGLVNYDVVISAKEFPFFELVEENEMGHEEPKIITPETEVTITTTYGELARVYYVMGAANGATHKILWGKVADLLGDSDHSIYWGNKPKHSFINYFTVQEKWESLFFKSKEQQEKELAIKQKRDMIAQLEKEIEQLGG